MTPRSVLRFALLAASCLLSVRSATCGELAGVANQATAEIGRLLESGTSRTRTSDALRQLYADQGNKPLWNGENLGVAQQALQHLQDAAQYGLAPGDYAVQAALPRAPGSNPGQVAQFDFELSAAVLAFLVDLHSGRTAPDLRWYAGALPQPGFDPVALLRKALREQRFDDAVAAAEPGNALYRRVRHALAQYRQLAPRFETIAPLPPLPAGNNLRTGMPFAGAASLVERLVLLGDMPQGASASDGIYTQDMAAAVSNFQLRHGLAQDGILGKSTMAVLSVPLTHRIRQLELTLERLRWMPALPAGPLIVVNVPSFRLWALDTRASTSPPQVEMRVIVGNAARTPTPLFIGQLRYLEFNPSWNVPRSIELEEILPKLARDSGYLAKQDMELVARNGQQIYSGTDALAALRAGSVRARQRPGSRNVLGPVKFAMPNPMNIYLHATSAQELFSRQRRDLSHGCIRLEYPAALAEFVLRDQAPWDRGAVLAAMQPGPTRTVMLAAPIPVVLLYATAVVDRQGRALFLEDVYGLDQKLLRALERAPTTFARATAWQE